MKVKTRGLWPVLVGISLTVAPLAASASAGSTPNVTVLTAPLGTGSYVLGATFEKISKETKAGIIVNSSQSPGFVYNIKKLTRDKAAQKNTVIGSGAGLASLATTGSAPFRRKYAPLKLIADYEVEGTWLATLNPKIKTVRDLIGKKVALGRSAQINWTIEPRQIIKYGYGIPLSKINLQYVSIKQAANSLLDGTVSAAIVGAYFNPATHKVVLSPQTLDLMSSGRKIHFIPWSKKAIVKTAKHGLAIAPYTIAAGSFQGLKHPLQIFSDHTAWMVSPNFPKKSAYLLAKLLISHVKEFGNANALGKLMSPELLVSGWPKSQIAPGALKAYKEAGLVK